MAMFSQRFILLNLDMFYKKKYGKYPMFTLKVIRHIKSFPKMRNYQTSEFNMLGVVLFISLCSMHKCVM